MPNETENTADELVTLIEEASAGKRPSATKNDVAVSLNKLEAMRTLAIDLHFQIERLEERLAYAERGIREAWRTIKMLQEAGLFDEDQYRSANNIVIDARSSTNTFTDVDTIKADLRKQRAAKEGDA